MQAVVAAAATGLSALAIAVAPAAQAAQEAFMVAEVSALCMLLSERTSMASRLKVDLIRKDVVSVDLVLASARAYMPLQHTSRIQSVSQCKLPKSVQQEALLQLW